MLPAIFIFLGFIVLFVFVRDFSVGLVLSGLLGMAWYFIEQYKTLKIQVNTLEDKLSELIAAHADSAESVNVVDNKKSLDTIIEESELGDSEEIKPSASLVAATLTLPQEKDPLIEKVPKNNLGSSAEVDSEEVEFEERYSRPVDVPRSDPRARSFNIPRTPPQPSMFEKLARKVIAAAWQWVTDGNVFVRVGIIILFMGMTFLIRYAIGENLIPIEVRLAAVGSVAIGLLIWGWLQREKRASFALVVQGGGIGLLYLTIFAGFSLYDVIPSGFAFLLLAVTVVLAAMLAVYQDAKALALFATIGGFLAPILTSTGSNNYIGLFSYYTLLNVGVFAVAWCKSWRVLNFVGFLFTFAVSSIWGASSYQAENFSTVQPFLIIFFLLYVAIGVLYALKRAPSFTDYVDSSLIFGTPLLAFGLQSAMVGHFEYGIAISAVCLAVFYLVLANFLWNKYTERLRLLSETFLSLGVIFATLAIPFAIDGTLTGATWAIEGLGIIWVSIRQQQKYRRLFGVMLIVAASIMLAYDLFSTAYGIAVLGSVANTTTLFTYAFANTVFIGSCIIAITASIASILLSREFEGRLPVEARIANGLLVYGLFVLLCGFEYQVYTFNLFAIHGNLLALLSLCCAIVYSVSANRFYWAQGHWVSVGSITALIIAAVLTFAYQSQLALHYGYVVWPLALLSYFYTLKQAQNVVEEKWLLNAHILISVLLVSLLLWEGLWQLLLGYSLLSIVFHRFGNRLSWPELRVCALVFLPVLVICSLGAVIVDGNLAMLSSIASSIHWPFPSGFVLWPFAFSVYFYLLYQNQSVAGKYKGYLHYAGALLIGLLLLWLGLWPLLLGASLLSGLCCYLWARFDWPEIHTVSQALLPVMLLVTGVKLFDNNFDPFMLQGFNVDIAFPIEAGYLLWPLAVITLFWSYRQYDKNNKTHTVFSLPSFFHGIGALLLTGLITWEMSWHVLDIYALNDAWHIALLPITALIMMTLILKTSRWPFTAHSDSYLHYALKPLLSFVVIWSFVQFSSSGQSWPLPWIPIVNPIDIIQAIVIVWCLLWREELIEKLSIPFSPNKMLLVLGGFIFLWANVDLLRAVHHWSQVEWLVPNIIMADISQTVLSLFWAICGLGITSYATRKQHRELWLYGAGLLAVVVLKLFILDLSAQETIERIISFTGVGVLLTLVGYFSPIPPKSVADDKQAQEVCDEVS